jgi:hypothetical protein
MKCYSACMYVRYNIARCSRGVLLHSEFSCVGQEAPWRRMPCGDPRCLWSAVYSVVQDTRAPMLRPNGLQAQVQVQGTNYSVLVLRNHGTVEAESVPARISLVSSHGLGRGSLPLRPELPTIVHSTYDDLLLYSTLSYIVQYPIPSRAVPQTREATCQDSIVLRSLHDKLRTDCRFSSSAPLKSGYVVLHGVFCASHRHDHPEPLVQAVEFNRALALHVRHACLLYTAGVQSKVRSSCAE